MCLKRKVVSMSVNGVQRNVIYPANVQNVQTPQAAVSVGTENPVVYQEPQKSSSSTKKVLLTLATLGAITYGIIRYRNAKALKPIVERLETAAKDGGKFVTETTKTKVKNPDGTMSQQVVKTIKTKYTKDGVKRAEIIHDIPRGERYTVVYDNEGNVVKNIVGRMSIPVNGEKAKLLQNMTYTFERNGDNVVTTARLVDYSGTKPLEISRNII